MLKSDGGLASGTDMGAALTDDNAFDTCFATGARQVRTPENFQLILIATSVPGHRIKIRFTGSEAGAEIFEPAV